MPLGVAGPPTYLTVILSVITECTPCPNQPSGTMKSVLLGGILEAEFSGWKGTCCLCYRNKQSTVR